ncbi:diguanylate cyclase domain-containing protein [Subtercola frigoramans]|uniref:Serine/threonine-protein kinase RsbW n=1 Tax=Subtercola frigoramans TaxID=120298 RepID=A0ABS2L6B9_9MICO|nr:diguanylate cyclase [Subtercola frigoramans]MBM7472635.1 serine/threonine-protein kinase RsbW [Subtercola frigoramans]
MSNTDAWRELFLRAPCGLVSTDSSGTVTAVNDTFLQMAAASRDDVLGDYLMRRLANGSKLFFETRLMPELRSQGRVQEVALDLLLPDRSILSVFVNAVVDTAADEPLIRFAIFDATGRRNYERELLGARRTAESSEARLRILQRAATQFAAAATEKELGSVLAEAARSATDASQVSVYFVGDPGEGGGRPGELVLAFGDRSSSERLSLADDAPEAETVRLGTPLSCASASEIRERFGARAEALRLARIEAFMALPIVDGSEVVGVLFCGFGRPRTIEPKTVDVLGSLIDQAVVVRQRIALQQLMQFQSLHDALTGLPNRLYLQGMLARVLEPVDSRRRAIGLLFVDLDGFKAINDALGHRGGDLVLREVSSRLTDAVRLGDTVVRLGGDEFLIVCDDVDADSIVGVALRVGEAIRSPLGGSAHGLPLSASIGISLYRGSDDGHATATADVLIRLADEAMYESKRGGKDRHTLVVV